MTDRHAASQHGPASAPRAHLAMSTPSRNDPCPCGSGRKYKRCCGAAGALALQPLATGMDVGLDAGQGYDENARRSACARLHRFALTPEFATHRERSFRHLWGPFADRMRDPQEDLRQRVPTVSEGELDYLLVDSVLPGGRTIVQTFLERERAALSPQERSFLTDLSRSCVSLYEIVRVEPGRGFELVDLWRSDRLWVHERLASQQLDLWDLIAARLLTRPDGRVVIDSTLWPFPSTSKPALIAGLEREYSAMRRLRGDLPAELFLKSSSPVFAQQLAREYFEPAPHQLATFDGEPLEPTRMEFEVHDPRKLRRRLADCHDLDPNGPRSYVWGKTVDGVNYGLAWLDLPSPKCPELIATAMSKAHARELRAILERVGRGEITWSKERTFTAEEWARQGGTLSAPAQSRSQRSDPVLARALEEAHYRKWPDLPVPALDGWTPRAAAKDEAMRPRVIELLKSLDSFQQKRARSEHQPPLDLSWLWRELGLEPPASPPQLVRGRVPVVDVLDWILRHAPTIAGGRHQARFERYKALVRAASGATPGQEFPTELACSRRPSRAKCVGILHVLVLDDTLLRWRCGACGDAEEVLGWSALLRGLEASARNFPAPERHARRVDPKDPWAELYLAVVGFRDLAPWRWMDDEQVFGVEDPATGEIAWCCVLGGAGEIEGLVAYLGDAGFDQWRRMQAGAYRQDESLFGQDALVLTFGDRESLSPEERDDLKSRGVPCRGRRAWPSLESHQFGRLPRSLDDAEVTRLAHTIDQSLTIAARAGDGERLTGPDADGRFLVRRLLRAGKPGRDWFEERVDPPRAIERRPADFDGPAVERLARTLPRPEGTWEIDVIPVPSPVEQSGREAFVPSSFLAIERGTEQVVHTDLQRPSDLLTQAQSGLLQAVSMISRRPSTVCVRRPWVSDGVGRVADALGIRVELCEELELLEAAVKHMHEYVQAQHPGDQRKRSQRGE